MGTSYTRVLKPGHANDFPAIIALGNKVRSILSGIVHDDNDLTEHVEEVQIQMQPRPDGGLAIIGWIGRNAVKGIPDEDYDEEVEIIPHAPTAEEIAEFQRQQQQAVDEISPFGRR
jgi:hypothetical protein